MQKSRFRADPGQQGHGSSTPGLWSWSRHPNYFGEIVLWIGVALIAVPVLRGWQWVTLISPLFVFLLLTRVSGVPLLEKRADERWGGQDDYEAYKAAHAGAGPPASCELGSRGHAELSARRSTPQPVSRAIQGLPEAIKHKHDAWVLRVRPPIRSPRRSDSRGPRDAPRRT